MDVSTVRMPRGRVWHLSRGREYVGPFTDTAELTWCDQPVEAAERLAAQIPAGGRICWRCVVAANDYRNVVLGVALSDRRPEVVNAWPTLLDQHADADVVDVEIVDDCEPEERGAYLRPDEFPAWTPHPGGLTGGDL